MLKTFELRLHSWTGQNDSVFDLVHFDRLNLEQEYMFINNIPYDSIKPNPHLAVDNGERYKNIYTIWPILADGLKWDPNNLPASTLQINYQTILAKTRNSKQLTNWYSGAGYPYTHADHHNLNVIPIDKSTNRFKILDPNDGGMAVSDNSGQTWSQITSYQTTQFYGADKTPAADQYLGGMQDNGTWYSALNPNSGSPYTFFLGGDGFAVDWKYDDPKQFLGSVYNNEIYKTIDGGNSIIAASNGFSDWGTSNSPFITSIAKSNEDPDLIFAVSASGAWRSDTFGDSWTLAPLPFKGAEYTLFAPIAISLRILKLFGRLQIIQQVTKQPYQLMAGCHLQLLFLILPFILVLYRVWLRTRRKIQQPIFYYPPLNRLKYCVQLTLVRPGRIFRDLVQALKVQTAFLMLQYTACLLCPPILILFGPVQKLDCLNQPITALAGRWRLTAFLRFQYGI